MICSDNTSLFEITHKIVPTIIGFFLTVFLISSDTFFFEMTTKLVLVIVISRYVYNNNMCPTLVLICSDTTFVVRDDI
jgi:hypothetical protein